MPFGKLHIRAAGSPQHFPQAQQLAHKRGDSGQHVEGQSTFAAWTNLVAVVAGPARSVDRPERRHLATAAGQPSVCWSPSILNPKPSSPLFCNTCQDSPRFCQHPSRERCGRCQATLATPPALAITSSLVSSKSNMSRFSLRKPMEWADGMAATPLSIRNRSETLGRLTSC